MGNAKRKPFLSILLTYPVKFTSGTYLSCDSNHEIIVPGMLSKEKRDLNAGFMYSHFSSETILHFTCQMINTTIHFMRKWEFYCKM